jgi:apolipoprotein N-acyltransferase
MYKNFNFLQAIITNITTHNVFLIFQKLLLALLSGSILSLAFLNHDYFYCAWFGLIPLLLAIEKTTLIQSYLIGLVTGLTLFTTAAYWIVDFITLSKDYGIHSGFLLAALYWLYSAHSIALAILLFNWLRKHSKVHDFVLFPLIFVLFQGN